MSILIDLIITSPHSFCLPNIPYRHCDTVAYAAATDLIKFGFGKATFKYFPSTYPRWQLDLNRAVSYNSDYRRNVRAEFPYAKLLVDVHSFPRKAYGPDVDLVVLDNVPGTWYGKQLYKLLVSNNISVAYIPGSTINDITEDARHNDIPAILLEYGEFLNLTQIDHINQVVRPWIVQMLAK
jgi:hypothetical protein